MTAQNLFAEELGLEELSVLTPKVTALQTIWRRFPRASLNRALAQYLLDHGRNLVILLSIRAQEDPERYAGLNAELFRLQGKWLMGESLSDRVDEDDLRARHALWIMEKVPELARLAANAVMKLAADNPLRDEERVRDVLLEQLARAIRGDLGTPSTDLAGRTDFILTFIAGLIEHELVPGDRLDHLFEAGQRLLEGPELADRGKVFRMAALSYTRKRSSEAAEAGNEEQAQRWREIGRDLVRPVVELEADPRKRLLLGLLLAEGGERSGFDDALRGLAGNGRGTVPTEAGKPDGINLFGGLALAKRLFAGGDHAQVVSTLAPQLASLTELYLTAVADRDVAKAGSELSEASRLLAFSRAHLGDWNEAVRVLDQAKSLRYRYQSALRASAEGKRLVELEAALYAHHRGVGELPLDLEVESAGSIQASAHSRLLEAYRRVRAKLPLNDMESPDVEGIAASLDDEEAVAVLGMRPSGVLLAVICRGDTQSPTGARVLPRSVANRLLEVFVGERRGGWLIALNAPGIGVEPSAALDRLIAEADEVLGKTLLQLLPDRPLRRLTVVPHDILHLVPYWALPSLESFDVTTAPSAAQLIQRRSDVPALAPRSLVVGNPTLDLDFASLEAARVAERLADGGFEVRTREREDATEANVTESLRGVSLLHFTGHGLSEVFRPLLSGLEVHPAEGSLAEDGGDPLPGLAAVADWGPMVDNERSAAVPHGRLYERVYPVTGQVELRLETGALGTLRGRYVLEHGEGAAAYGQQIRLAELWTVGDLMQEEGLRDCRFVFLSSCNAGLGALSAEVDEFAGLPAALDLAGASIVVSPLWPVDEVFAALFADLFYAAFAASTGEVDVVELLGQVRRKMRWMRREEAAAWIADLASGVASLLKRTMLKARALKIREGPEHPFEHPIDWAAFQAMGVRTAVVEARAGVKPVAPDLLACPVEPPSRPDPGSEAPIPAAEPAPPRPSEADEADDWDVVARATADPVIHRMAADVMVRRGERRLARGEVDQAIADFRRALELRPDLPAAHSGLAKAHASRSELDRAVEEYSRALELDPDDRRARLLRANAYRRQEKTAAAAEDFDYYLERWPHPLAFHSRGLAHQLAGDYDRAIADYTRMVEEWPEAGASYHLRSQCWSDKGESDRALEDLDLAALLLPRNAEVFQERGFLRSAQRDYDRAIRDYDRALETRPDYAEAFFNRACARSMREQGSGPAFFRRAAVREITTDLAHAFELEPSLREHARNDPELSWARKRRRIRRLIADADRRAS